MPVAACATALALRLLALHFQPYVTFDGTEYVRFADALRSGQPFASVFPPGYPALIALARPLVHDRVGAAVAVSLVCGTLLPLPVWWLARRALSSRWAAAPAFVVALHPELARFSAVTMSESSFLLALYAGVALAAAALDRAMPARGGAVRAALAGLALGAAFATRPEGLIPAAVLVALLAWRAPGRARSAAAFALGFLALAVPCWLWFHATLGVWTLTPKLGALHAAPASWRAAEVSLARPLGAPAPPAAGTWAQLARELPGALARWPANAFRQLLGLFILWPWPLLALSLWGLVRRRGIESVPLLLLFVLPLFGLTLQPRFALSALPALGIVAVAVFARPAPRWARALALVLAAFGTAACAWANFDIFRVPFDGVLDDAERAGHWLAGASRPNEPVIDRKPFVAFYADRPFVALPDVPYDSIVGGAVRAHAGWLVVEQALAESMRRQLLPLLYDEAFRARETRLELRYVGGRTIGYRIGIFRVLQPGKPRSRRPITLDVGEASPTP